jgi:hypothetical protein
MEQSCGTLEVEFVKGKHCDFSTSLPKGARANSGACTEVHFPDMEHCSCSLAVEFIPGKQESTEISAPILPRERELSLSHAQRCNFLIMEQCCGPLAIENISGKSCDFSTYVAKRARAQSGACAKVQFPDYGTVLWSPGSRNISRKQ